MCGIAGIIGRFEERQIDEMLTSQYHRGPDYTGKWNDDSNAVLGHNRLSIIDLSENANQPFIDETGRYIMVFNGEIYNYIELRNELNNRYHFKTASDTEVLLAAYIIFGSKCLSRLNGMFSFAIWDKQEKKLFAARDRFGVKPFFYSLKDTILYFSSEIKAIHAAGINKVAKQETWASYFVYGSYGNIDDTFWENIMQLPGGHFLEFFNSELVVSKWYFFDEILKNQPKNFTYKQAKSHYLELLKDSISLRFRADVSLGFNISGGLDSSVLLALVNNYQKGKDKINAFTFYCNSPNYDELPWVEMMIANTNNPLQKILLESSEVKELAQKIAKYQDEPYGGIPTIAYAKLFEEARKNNVLVVLDGQGMDEQWAGYDYYFKENEATIQGVQDIPYKANMLSADFLSKAKKPIYPKPFEDQILNKQYRDLFYTKIPRALRFNDRISMAFSTELREPFLDFRLVEFAFSLPLSYKVKKGVSKYMLREIAAEYLSNDLVFAPKRALQTPQREWLATDLKDWVTLSVKQVLASAYGVWFNKEEVEKELKLYFEGNTQSSFHIWQCLSVNALLAQ
jgi:asparagine synthase (glutamine-hydrolysing)